MKFLAREKITLFLQKNRCTLQLTIWSAFLTLLDTSLLAVLNMITVKPRKEEPKKLRTKGLFPTILYPSDKN